MKKIICLPIFILFIAFSISVSAKVSYPIYEKAYGPPSDILSYTMIVGESDEYIFARKTRYADSFEFEHSGLYTNDDKKELIYVILDFGKETLYISDDGHTVLEEAGLFSGGNINRPVYTLYKNGNVIKEYKFSSLYNVGFEMNLTGNGYIWQKCMIAILQNMKTI